MMIYNLMCERQQINNAQTSSGIHICSGVEKGPNALLLLNIDRRRHIVMFASIFLGLFQRFCYFWKNDRIAFIHLKRKTSCSFSCHREVQHPALAREPFKLRSMKKEFYHSAFFIRKEKGEWVDNGCQTDHVFFLKRVTITADNLIWK